MSELSLLLLLLLWSPSRSVGERVQCSVVEEQPRGTPVCSLAHRVSASPAASARYQLVERNLFELFDLHRTSGQLSLNRSIDRESIADCRLNPNRPCRLELAATYLPDSADPSGMRLIDISVVVEDINDNPPRFLIASTNSFHSAIREHDRSAKVLLPKATDPDAGRNGTVVYNFPDALRHTSLYAKFSLSEGDEGNPELRVISDIDLEGEERDIRYIELKVEANDEGSPRLGSNLTVRLTVENSNDFEPVFDTGPRSTVTIKENATINSVVFAPRATDRDEQTGHPSRLSYNLRPSGDASRQFRIDRMSGEIRLAASLDAEKRQAYSLEVRAVDGHSPDPKTATMTLSVQVEDVNDNAPEIQVTPLSAGNSLSVLENQPSAMLAIVDVVDRDVDEINRRLDCDIGEFNRAQEALILQSDAAFGSGSDIGGGFGRPEDPGRRRYILKNSRPLDREQAAEYNLRLTCHDSAGLSTVRDIRVLVRDVNDSPPMFPSSHRVMQVSENKPRGTIVGTVLAQDADEGENARTVYQVSESCSAYLGIGPQNGTLYTRVPFDREVNASVACTVTARDARRPELSAAIGIRVDIKDENDCSPVFIGSESGNFTFQVAENSPPGIIIGQLVAKDADEEANGRVTFSLARPSSLFRVLPGGGIQLIAPSGQLDRERSSSHQLLVRAMDNGNPQRRTDAMVEIQVLDENDNSPRFLFPSGRNSTVNVSVYERPGEEIVLISAEDADSGENGRLMYSLLAGHGGLGAGGRPACDADLFHLNPRSGMLVLRRSLPLHFAGRFACRLTVRATDDGLLASRRRSSQQSLTVRFTGQRPRRDSAGDDGGGAAFPGEDAKRNPVDGGSGARDLVVVTVCVALSFLVLLCVVLLLAYFCYYLQMPGQAAGSSGEAAAAGVSASTIDGMATRGGGRKKRLGWLEKLGFRSVGVGGSAPAPNRSNGRFAESSLADNPAATAGGRNFISMPMRQNDALLKSAAINDSDDEFASAGPQYFASRRQSAKQTGYYQRPQTQLRYQNQRRNSDDSDAASAMLPQYTSAAGHGDLDRELENGSNSRSSFLRSGLGRLNSLSVDAKNSLPEGYYKSLRPPSTDPTRRRWQQPQQQQQNLLLDELPASVSAGQKFQTVRYLVDTSNASASTGGSGRTAEAGGRGGFVYGSPYLTSSFV